MKRIFYIWMLMLLGFNAAAGTLVQFRTTFGDIDVELYDQDKPGTVKNFIRYVQTGLYLNGIIHRCDPKFVIQGGGFYVGNRNTPSAVILDTPTFPAITNEYGVGKTYSNVYGTIAMAQAPGNTNSATSQWFISLTNNAFLDTNGFFTVFGRMVRGTNVLSVFRTFSGANVNSNIIYDLRVPLQDPAFGELPVLTPALTFNDLIYVDVSLLNVHVQQLTNSTRQISWNSVVGRTNYVEYTTNMPPSWQRLIATNGTGSTLQVIDAVTNAPRRFYRVRVTY